MIRNRCKRGTRPRGSAAWQTLIFVTAMSVAPAALAHTGMTAWHDAQSGWWHPFTGADHLLAMFALGIWAGQSGGRRMILLPAAFVGCLVLGGLLGVMSGPLPAVELAIMASLLVFGVAIAATAPLSDRVAAVAVGGLALFHGVAHGLEMPASAAVLPYSMGFVLATVALHVAGMALALALKRTGWTRVVRLAGAAVATAGVVLLIH